MHCLAAGTRGGGLCCRFASSEHCADLGGKPDVVEASDERSVSSGGIVTFLDVRKENPPSFPDCCQQPRCHVIGQKLVEIQRGRLVLAIVTLG